MNISGAGMGLRHCRPGEHCKSETQDRESHGEPQDTECAPPVNWFMGARSSSARRPALHVEPEFDHISVLHHVFLPLDPQFARFPCLPR